MPMIFNAGLSKKIGTANYGSLGASCNVTVELDQHLLRDDLADFHSHVRKVQVACAQAVNDELARQQEPSANPEPVPASQQQHRAPSSPSNSNGNGSAHRNGSHRASQKQIDYVNQLAQQIRGLGIRRLETLADKMFAKPMAELTSLDASGLIDTLKSIKTGDIALNAALDGVTT